MVKIVRYPLSPKAAQTIEAARSARNTGSSRPFDMQHLYDLAGWDADAKFAQARANLKAEANISISHRFVGNGGEVQHEFSLRAG